MNTVLLRAPLFSDIVDDTLADSEVHISGDLGADPRLVDAVGICTLLSDRVDAEFLSKAPKLKVVANYAVGYDNIDVSACAERGVTVTNTPDVLTQATAEIAVALTFACARHIVQGDAMCRRGEFKGWGPDLFLGRELSGCRAVIVGRGRIGVCTGNIYAALGMDVSYLTRKSSDADIEQSLRTADVVSLHTPYNEGTHHYLNAERIAMMKGDAILINTARGAVIDEEALCDALERGHLFAVGLDVFEREPVISELLLTHPRTVLMPHVGSATFKARRAMARLALGSIAEVLQGKVPANRVTR